MNVSKFKNRFVYRSDIKMLFDQQRGVTHVLNETADRIAQLLAEGKDIDCLITILSEEYEVSVGLIKEDVQSFLLNIFSLTSFAKQGEPEKNLALSLSFPLTLELELTSFCNWNCGFCYCCSNSPGGARQNVPSSHCLDFELAKRVLIESKNNGLVRVRYNGGETTLYPNFDELVDFGSKLGFYQVVFTNGSTINKDIVSRWRDFNVREVLISLHGNRQMHNGLTGVNMDTYDKTILSIKEVMSAGLKVVVEMTVVRENLVYITEVIKILSELGVDEFRLMRYVARGDNDREWGVPIEAVDSIIEMLETENRGINIKFPCSQKYCLSSDNKVITDKEILAQRKRYLNQNCYAGLTWASVSHDGFLRGCPHSSFRAIDLKSGREPLKETWQKLLRNPIVDFIDSIRCKNCLAWDYCLGGCYLDFISPKT